jgi:hypothetical protein
MSKENRLGSLIQPKGSAPRPVEIPQRGEPAPVEVAQPAPVFATPGPTVPKKSLTLKLTQEQYKRLREYGFRNEMSHQSIIEKALMRFLDEEGT